MEPPSVVFIVGDTDSTDLDRISNETLEVMLSEKDMTVSPSVVEGHSATGYKKNGSRRGSTPSMTSSNSSIFPACSPTGSVSGIHDFGAADERCAFVQPLYDDRNSVSGRRSLPIGDDVTGRERVFGSESMVNVAAAGSGAETAGSSWHVTADDPGHSSPADRHRDGEEADDENEEDDLLDAVRNVFEQKMAHYGQKYENRIKKLEAANREKELTIQQLQATINSLMASLRGGPGSGVELSNRPTCSPSPSPGT